MKFQKKPLAVGCMTALAGILSAPNAFATGTCYAFTSPDPTITSVDGGPPIVLRYIATKVGDINTDSEARNFAHLKQVAYSLVGKATALFDFRCDQVSGGPVCPASSTPEGQLRLMTTIDGTIITGKLLTQYSPDSPGAHMGINMHLLRRVAGGYISIGPVDLECTSEQTVATPAYWRCNIRAEFDLPFYDGIFWQLAANDEVVLQRVSSATTPACSVFQDGEPVVYPD